MTPPQAMARYRQLHSTSSFDCLCSIEHENAVGETSATPAHSLPSPATTGTHPMAETADQIRNVLERIRDDAQEALKLLGNSVDQRSLAWKCAKCGNIKHFTRPVLVEVAAPCPKCRGELFGPT